MTQAHDLTSEDLVTLEIVARRWDVLDGFDPPGGTGVNGSRPGHERHPGLF